MDPQMKKGIGLAKKGLRAVKGGRTAFRWGGKLKRLPPLRKKAAAKAAAKAYIKEEKQLRAEGRKTQRQMRRRILRRDAKAMYRVLSALRKRYF